MKTQKIKNYKLIQLEFSSFVFDDKNNLSQTELEEYYKTQFDFSNIEILILTGLMEEYTTDQIEIINQGIRILKNLFTHLQIIVIMGTQYLRKGYTQNSNSAKIENDFVYYVNAFWYTLYYLTIQQQMCKICDSYKKNNPKDFLFLIGKPDREHRLKMLYKLYEKNLLDNSNWRFVIHNTHIKQRCINLLSEIKRPEVLKFIKSVSRKLDNIKVDYYSTGSHYPGIPFDYKIFDEVKFQIICETDHKSSIISEKTYVSILNKRPFLMVSEPGHNEQLRQYGFKTFEQYCRHKNYQDNTKNLDQRLDQVIENVEYWIKNIDNYHSQIEKDVEHNYNLFVSLGAQEEKNIKKIIETHNIKAEPSDIIKGYYIK
jgi:hypothetical protein